MYILRGEVAIRVIHPNDRSRQRLRSLEFSDSFASPGISKPSRHSSGRCLERTPSMPVQFVAGDLFHTTYNVQALLEERWPDSLSSTGPSAEQDHPPAAPPTFDAGATNGAARYLHGRPLSESS